MNIPETREERWKLVLYACISLEVIILGLLGIQVYANALQFPLYQLGALFVFTVLIYVAFLKNRAGEISEAAAEEGFKNRAIIDSIPFGAVILEINDEVAFVNPMARSLLGLDMMSHDIPDLGECLPYDILAAIHDNKWGGYTTRGLEGLFDVSVAISPIKDSDGELLGKMLVLQGADVPKEEETIKDDSSELSLQYVLDTEALLRPQRSEEAFESRVLSLLTKNALQRKQLLDSLKELPEETGRLNQVLIQVITDVKGSYAMKRIGIETDIGSGIPLPSPAIFVQALREVMINSLLYSNEGKKVFLATRAEEEFHEIIVRDEGVGMNEKTLAVAQEEGSIGNNSDAFLKYRRGRGLPTAIRLMEHIGGSLSIESEEGLGTRVVLRVNKEH